MTLVEKVRAQFPPGLFPLWLAGFISAIGDEIHWVALLWLIYDLTGSKVATGLVGSAQFLPAVMFGLFAGVLVDRLERRRVMMVADIARALLVTIIPLLLISGYLRGIHLGIIAFMMSTFTVAFMPARDALVPELVPKEGLSQANALIQGSLNLAFLIGAGIAAAVLPLVKIPGLFYMDAVSFLASFVCIWWIKKARVRQGEASVPSSSISTLSAVREGLSHAYRDSRIRGLLLITAIDNLFIMGPAIVGVPVYVKDHLRLGPQGLASIDAAFAIGVVIGTVILHRWGRQWPKGRVILSAIVFDGLTFIPLLWTPTLWATVLVVFIHSLGIPFITVPRTTLIQEIVAPRMQGRIFSMINLAVYGLTALSALLTGLALEWIPVTELYAIIGLIAALIGLTGWTIRDLRLVR
jgi:DHA3 family macrolide efflux protein-like MFS transporter